MAALLRGSGDGNAQAVLQLPRPPRRLLDVQLEVDAMLTFLSFGLLKFGLRPLEPLEKRLWGLRRPPPSFGRVPLGTGFGQERHWRPLRVKDASGVAERLPLPPELGSIRSALTRATMIVVGIGIILTLSGSLGSRRGPLAALRQLAAVSVVLSPFIMAAPVVLVHVGLL